MGATLKELAKAAGVSVATASRAFSRPEKVEASTRERIVALAAELNYVPNRAAQALSTGLTRSLGLVVPDLTNPFFTGVIKGALDGATASGRTLLIADTDERPEREFAHVQHLSQRTDAVILCSSRMSDAELDQVRGLGPMVLINRLHDHLPAVMFDPSPGVQESAAHLRALNHTKVAYVAGPAVSFSNARRQAALQEHFPAAGLALDIVGPFEPTLEGGRRSADAVLASGASAVMVYNDVMALGLIGRLSSFGVRVPDDVSVIGWDDIEFAEMFTPPLTTVRMPREAAGRAAVAFLDAALADRTITPEPLATQLVTRRTTARAPQDTR